MPFGPGDVAVIGIVDQLNRQQVNQTEMPGHPTTKNVYQDGSQSETSAIGCQLKN